MRASTGDIVGTVMRGLEVSANNHTAADPAVRADASAEPDGGRCEPATYAILSYGLFTYLTLELAHSRPCCAAAPATRRASLQAKATQQDAACQQASYRAAKQQQQEEQGLACQNLACTSGRGVLNDELWRQQQRKGDHGGDDGGGGSLCVSVASRT